MGLFILSRLAFEKCLHKMLVQKMIQQKWCSRHNLMECPNFSWKTFLISFNERKQPTKENVIFDHVIWTFDVDCSELNIIWTSLFDCWTPVSHQPWAVRVCSLLRLVDKLWGWNTAKQLFQIILILYLVNCVTFGSSIWKCMKMHLRLLTSLNTHAYTNAYIDVLTYIWNIIYMKMTPKPYYMLSSGLIDKEPPLQNKQNCKRLSYLKVLWHKKKDICTII